MRYVALDVGSTWIKCFGLDTDALTAHEEGRAVFPPPAAGLPPGRYEVDAVTLARDCMTLIHDALDRMPDCAGILIGTLMHGFVIADSRLKPLGYVSWRDAASLERRTDGKTYLAALEEILPGTDFARTGAPLRPKLAVANLYARLKQGLMFPANARFFTLGGYLNARMGGTGACHLSSAASTGLCDAVNAAWMPKLFQAIGAKGLLCPAIEREFHPTGAYRYKGQSYALYPDMGDHQVCALGSLARPDTDVNINIGTGGMAGIVTDRFLPAHENRPLLEGLYIRTKTGLPAGSHLQDKTDSLHVSWQEMTADPPVNAEIRALYAAYAKEYADAIAALGDAKAERIAFSGGAALRNPPLRHAIENACKLPATTPKHDAASLGMLRLALLAEGGNLRDTGERLRERFTGIEQRLS